mgnify:CR=1 FL=1
MLNITKIKNLKKKKEYLLIKHPFEGVFLMIKRR